MDLAIISRTPFSYKAFLLLAALLSVPLHAETTLLLRGEVISQDSGTSFQQQGVSHQRFNDNNLQLSQAILSADFQLNNDWKLQGVFNAYSDGEEKVGVSQLFAQYRPLVRHTIKPEVKVGAFYPALSVENTDMAWLSPHFLSNSAINSWIGEELRIGGVEASLRQNGRQVRRSWSWKALAGLFKGNDTTGTLLSWRGFALHDRQSLFDDRVNFYPLPWIVNDDELNAPAWTEPFREIDNRIGFYLGGHLAYQRQSELRYYYYDNRANPIKVDPDRLYAWRTKFHSLSVRHRLSSKLTLFSQALAGSTLMGEEIVSNHYYSAYVAASYQLDNAVLSTRLDWYHVIDDDVTWRDPNRSIGQAVTVNYSFPLSELLALSAEWQLNKGEQANRVEAQRIESFSEHSAKLAITLRY
ncbi:hypothetical protein [Alteromonas australica]|uniref:hypothetical protein n=1 Tax=Alteromonas australica TaxID=589873 RepID=UPI0023580179|nr:hypothetical protein [Alteromonas australica]